MKARSYRRALGLLELGRGKTYTDVSETLRVAVPTLSCWAAQYRFCQALAAEYPQATKIRLVQGNLNTHDTSTFYENLPADEAQALANRFEFHFTPKSASWLNMIEIEFCALARLCLDRRIPTLEKLEREVLSLVEQRKADKIKITWQFSVQTARSELNSHYVKVQPDDQKFKDI